MACDHPHNPTPSSTSAEHPRSSATSPPKTSTAAAALQQSPAAPAKDSSPTDQSLRPHTSGPLCNHPNPNRIHPRIQQILPMLCRVHPRVLNHQRARSLSHILRDHAEPRTRLPALAPSTPAHPRTGAKSTRAPPSVPRDSSLRHTVRDPNATVAIPAAPVPHSLPTEDTARQPSGRSPAWAQMPGQATLQAKNSATATRRTLIRAPIQPSKPDRSYYHKSSNHVNKLLQWLLYWT